MNYVPIRDRIGVLLKEVEWLTSENVFDRPRLVADWKSFLERFTIPHPEDSSIRLVCACWYTRLNAPESATGIGDRDEAGTLVAVQRTEKWPIIVAYGFKDDPPSEEGFQLLVDRIQEKFRWKDQLGIPTIVEQSEPLSLTWSGLWRFGTGEDFVLCHKAEFILELTQRDTTV